MQILEHTHFIAQYDFVLIYEKNSKLSSKLEK